MYSLSLYTDTIIFLPKWCLKYVSQYLATIYSENYGMFCRRRLCKQDNKFTPATIYALVWWYVPSVQALNVAVDNICLLDNRCRHIDISLVAGHIHGDIIVVPTDVVVQSKLCLIAVHNVALKHILLRGWNFYSTYNEYNKYH